jgi:hypothetical protein
VNAPEKSISETASVVTETDYVSPIPIYTSTFDDRHHCFPCPDGGGKLCDPKGCRECWREKNWTLGQEKSK